MSLRANYFKIGVFVISATVIAVIGIVILGVGTFFQDKVMMETYIDGSVQGLDVGSPLKFRGVKLGNVEEITLADQEYNLDHETEDYFRYGRYVVVKVSIEPKELMTQKERRLYLEKAISQGLRVRLASQGITGAAYLEADYLDPERHPPLTIPWKPRNYYIPSVPSTITAITDSVKKVVRKMDEINVQGITDSIKKALDMMSEIAGQADVEKIGENVGKLIAEFRETNKQLGPIISDASVTMATVRKVVVDTQQSMEKLVSSSADASVSIKNIVKTVDAASGGLPENLAYLKRIMRRLDDLVSSLEQDIDETSENFKLISGNIEELTENAKEYPSQLLFGKPPTRFNPGDQ